MILFRSLRRFATDKIIKQETLIFPRTLETINEGIKTKDVIEKQPNVVEPVEKKEELIDDWNKEPIIVSGERWRAEHQMPSENGFTYKGSEPTMFGDWQHKGRTTDF